MCNRKGGGLVSYDFDIIIQQAQPDYKKYMIQTVW